MVTLTKTDPDSEHEKRYLHFIAEKLALKAFF